MKERIIIALDVDTYGQARRLVDQLEEAVCFKIGLRPFLKFGDRLIDYLKEKGKKTFLDLKFKDIPNTVHGAVQSSLRYSPDMLTIHLSGGGEMIRKAVEAAREKEGLKILGVTVLTSLSADDLRETGIHLTPAEAVMNLCQLGINNGLSAFVCSPHEIGILRKKFGDSIILVTPGIRPRWAASQDQKRVFTPEDAIQAGSDYLVIGRPIIGQPDPAAAFADILEEVRSAAGN